MKRSSILALYLVMVVGGGLAWARDALGANPKRGGALTVVHGVDISNFDVQAAPGYEVVWINMNIHNQIKLAPTEAERQQRNEELLRYVAENMYWVNVSTSPHFKVIRNSV